MKNCCKNCQFAEYFGDTGSLTCTQFDCVIEFERTDCSGFVPNLLREADCRSCSNYIESDGFCKYFCNEVPVKKACSGYKKMEI